MEDIVERIGNSLVQHGKHNDRVYLMKLDPADLPGIVDEVDALAVRRGYSKIFAKVPAETANLFLEHGYDAEARVPGFYGGERQGMFLARYLADERRARVPLDQIERVLQVCRERQGDRPPMTVPEPYELLVLDPRHAPAIASVYRRVFETYPFPIHDSTYIARTMEQNFAYFGVFDGKTLVAVSSAEMDPKASNAEMTDFATLPDSRGKSLATPLLGRMESAMRQLGIHTAFTIARALSFGMNITFARLGYTFGGTLYNNTNIGGGLECMNVWYKHLEAPSTDEASQDAQATEGA